MCKYLHQTSNNTQRLYLDRKMIGILCTFAILGICLVISIVIATNTLSALRGFASFQTNWTEARKEASLHLSNYMQSGENHYFTRFDSALTTISDAQKIRQELLSEDSDYQEVRSNFLKLHVIPEDMDNMITTFKWFHDFSDFKKSIQFWIVSDQLMKEVEELASHSRQKIENGTFSSTEKEDAIETLFSLDKELTQAQYEVASALSSGTRFLNTIILWVSSSLGCILLLLGGFLSFRFLKSLKRWRREIEISEQKYQSLFYQNPNAVYSVSKEGEFLKGNKVIEDMSGYTLDELKGEQFGRFIAEKDREKVAELFKKAAEGDPQTYEATAIKNNGEHLHLEITNLPIYVDDEIIGVYGIAQDVTERLKAQQKIKEQLEEKTHLLSEIHDRVKNNLALISGLIQLQRDKIEEKQQKIHLDDTVSRIHSMAMVHEKLYHSETFSSVEIDEYIHELCESVEQSFDNNGNTELIIDADPVKLSINQAIPTALLLNELLSNAYKYGVDSEKGKIKVRLFETNGQIILQVADEGKGLPEEYDLEEPRTLGLRLVKVLIQQLQASYELSRKNGTTFSINFTSK